ncbi:unnamed protein product [Trichogramma brassicae]|uniref:Reverse transcriptase domain-containing protein n=1 Tax=Trichogramma brassicae TaxID=86971 RepID=A0A6H5IJB0_9HYME|nr:unnamed protein product [Trichogramma brassicae]
MSDDGTPPPWVSTLLSRFDRLETSMNGRLASIEASLLDFYERNISTLHPSSTTRTASLASTGVSLLRSLQSDPTTIVLLRLCERRLGVLASSRVPPPPHLWRITIPARFACRAFPSPWTIGVTAKRNPSPLAYFSSETLCQHFARVSSASPPLTSEIVKTLLSVPLPRTTPSFSFARVTADVLSAMARCTSSSTGPDGIPLSVLKLASSTLAEHIANLANRSFESGTFPSAWKFSSVVALSKCSTPSSPSDTRPISLLAELSKIVERLAHAQLSAHLSRHSLLDPQQHGFRPGHST